MMKLELVGERRALSSLVFGFFGALFTLNSFFVPELRPLLLSMGALYLTAFFSVASGWFWGRWVALGLAVQGTLSGVLMLVQGEDGLNPFVLFYGIAHGLAWLSLSGKVMSDAYEGSATWRQKYRIEDGGAERIGRTVMRVTMALPMLIGLVFAPGGGGEGAAIALALGSLALWGSVRLRAWAPLAAGGAGAVLMGGWLARSSCAGAGAGVMGGGVGGSMSVLWLPGSALLAGVVLLSAFAVFAGPIVRFLRSR